MFQQEQVRRQLHTLHSSVLIIDIRVKVDPRTQQPIPAHADTLWEVEVKTASPIRNTQETPLSQSVDAVLEVQLLMKGLLDLRRQDL
jgi:mediator of RNA polymerase II transcription subunit 18